MILIHFFLISFLWKEQVKDAFKISLSFVFLLLGLVAYVISLLIPPIIENNYALLLIILLLFLEAIIYLVIKKSSSINKYQ